MYMHGEIKLSEAIQVVFQVDELSTKKQLIYFGR